MTDDLKGQYYQKALELVKEGKNEQALECLLEHLRRNPCDSEALNDTGAVCYCMGKTSQAIEFLEQAVRLSPDSGEMYWNLAEAYLSANMPSWAARLFGDIERLGLDNFDLYNRTAKLFVDKNDKANAIEMLLKSLEKSPNQDLLYPMVEVLKSKRVNLSFVNCTGGNGKSLKGLVDYFAKRFDLSYVSNAEKFSNFENCDIVWFESVSRCLVDVSQKANCKILIKLNESDVDSEILDRINWGNVERVFVPEVNYIKKQLFDRLPLLQIQTTVTTYADVVDLKEFELQNLGPGKSLVCLDDICAENNPMGLIQCMQKLNYIDRDYKLFFAGDIQNHQLENYMRFMVRRLGLDSCVFFDNCSHDLAAYLENKHYVVSGSVSQKFNERILQAMACGLKPVIHNGPLASKKFKSKFLFNISEDFCKTVLSEDYNPIEYRRFVEDKYSLSKQLSIFHKIIVDLEKQIESSDRSFSLESVENLSSSLGSKVKNQSLQQNNLVSSY